MLTQPNIRYLTDIYFEPGSVSVLHSVLAKYNIKLPLIVTDRGVVKLGMISKLGIANPVLYDGVETNPTETMAIEAAGVYAENKCDGIVAFGGGSPIDLAKCAAVLVNHRSPLEHFSAGLGGGSKITGDVPRIIAIPTTAGSGSELGRAALVTLNDGRKVGIISDRLMPSACICDPELTLTMPSLLTAATGMDALSHCVECFCSPRINPIADAISLDGLERGFKYIVRATHKGDLKTRAEMMMCSLQGGLSFQKGLGAVHSLSHPLGALTAKKLHHGTLNAIFLPHVLRFNINYCMDKMQAMTNRLQLKDAAQVADAFEKLCKELGLPSKLRDLGVTGEELEPLAEQAMNDHCTATNPRPLLIDDFRKLYADAW
ncbi:MAG: iron-containing alcohol dehydrogenase [Chitinophagaceae bacterium]|nr:iron-containing alcohol dehydrogenase [Chitinophagaceae bacterium]